MTKLRAKCIKRGASSIKGISRFWKEIDDDSSRSLTLEEFERGLSDHNLELDFTKEEIAELYKEFDADQDGRISYDEFLVALRVSCFHV